MTEQFLTPAEAAEVLRIPRRKIWKLIQEGKLPVIVLSPRQRRIPLPALVEMAQKKVEKNVQ